MFKRYTWPLHNHDAHSRSNPKKIKEISAVQLSETVESPMKDGQSKDHATIHFG
jgi:hypothetical protein